MSFNTNYSDLLNKFADPNFAENLCALDKIETIELAAYFAFKDILNEEHPFKIHHLQNFSESEALILFRNFLNTQELSEIKELRLLSLLIIFNDLIENDDLVSFYIVNHLINFFTHTECHNYIISKIISLDSRSSILRGFLEGSFGSQFDLNFTDFIKRFNYSVDFPEYIVDYLNKYDVEALLLLTKHIVLAKSVTNFNLVKNKVVEIQGYSKIHKLRLKYLSLSFGDYFFILNKEEQNNTFISHYEQLFWLYYEHKYSNSAFVVKKCDITNLVDESYFNAFIEVTGEILQQPNSISAIEIDYLRNFIKSATEYLSLEEVFFEFNCINDGSILRRILRIKPLNYSEKLIQIKNSLHRKVLFRKFSNTLGSKSLKNKLIKI